jgi:hypothetical protein
VADPAAAPAKKKSSKGKFILMLGILVLLLACAAILAVARPTWVVGWDRLIALILVVALYVPIGRYKLPGSLPFDLDLYRIVVALCVLAWGAALLIDSRVRLRGTAFDHPLALIGACVLASEMTNPARVNAYGSHVVKSTTFFLSFILVYYLTATTIFADGGIMHGSVGL